MKENGACDFFDRRSLMIGTKQTQILLNNSAPPKYIKLNQPQGRSTKSK